MMFTTPVDIFKNTVLFFVYRFDYIDDQIL